MPTDHYPCVLPLGDGQLLVRGQAVLDLARLAQVGLGVVRRDGISIPSRLVPLLRALEAEARAAMSAGGHRSERESGTYGHADMANAFVLAPSGQDEVDVEEASQMLGVGIRQVRRMTHELEGRKVGRSWVFPRLTVAAVVLERSAA